MRGAGPGRELVDALAGSLAFFVTAVSAFELALGCSFAADPEPVLALLAAPTLALTHGAALRAGELARELSRAGRALDVRDAMQAGICLGTGAVLVTRNVRHFDRVTELDVASPQQWLARLGAG
ncbi:MAG: type II toxin-antitoxin system VapC family toxin [Actinomycetota bacterium]|nr:type II toxin-antitoxin system VapC family toxin [Actinomycetota bacterium]